MSLISLIQVRRSHRVAASVAYALDDLSLSVGAGEYLAVTGPSGSGKSTLLNMLSLLERPDGGELLWAGRPLSRASEEEWHSLRLRHVGYILQRCHLIERYNVAQNVDLGLAASGATAGERRERIAAMLDHLDLLQHAELQPSQLSMGQQHCVAIARAAVGQPALLLADEPTAQLDSRQAQQVMRLLKTLNAAGSAVVLASHDPAQAAHAMRTIQLERGRITADALHRP